MNESLVCNDTLIFCKNQTKSLNSAYSRIHQRNLIRHYIHFSPLCVKAELNTYNKIKRVLSSNQCQKIISYIIYSLPSYYLPTTTYLLSTYLLLPPTYYLLITYNIIFLVSQKWQAVRGLAAPGRGAGVVARASAALMIADLPLVVVV